MQVSATLLGEPDVGLLTPPEMSRKTNQICMSIPQIPVIVDADTGKAPCRDWSLYWLRLTQCFARFWRTFWHENAYLPTAFAWHRWWQCAECTADYQAVYSSWGQGLYPRRPEMAQEIWLCAWQRGHRHGRTHSQGMLHVKNCVTLHKKSQN